MLYEIRCQILHVYGHGRYICFKSKFTMFNMQCLYYIYIDVDMDDLLTHCIRFDDLHNNLDMTHSNRSILSNRTVTDILDDLLA